MRQLPDAMQMIRQHHPGIYLERPLCPRHPHRLAQGLDLIHQQPSPTLRNRDREEHRHTG